jgi:hypothetical protein
MNSVQKWDLFINNQTLVLDDLGLISDGST